MIGFQVAMVAARLTGLRNGAAFSRHYQIGLRIVALRAQHESEKDYPVLNLKLKTTNKDDIFKQF